MVLRTEFQPFSAYLIASHQARTIERQDAMKAIVDVTLYHGFSVDNFPHPDTSVLGRAVFGIGVIFDCDDQAEREITFLLGRGKPVLVFGEYNRDRHRFISGVGNLTYTYYPDTDLANISRKTHGWLKGLDLLTASEIRKNTITNGDLTIDMDQRRIIRSGVELPNLTPKEFRILAVLAIHMGRVLSHSYLLDYVWEGEGADSGILKTHVSHLRHKVEPDPRNPIYIETKPGFGYKMPKREAQEE